MNTKTTRVFSFAGIGFSILSILFCFVGTFIVDTGTHSENVGLIEVFSLASAAREPDADFIALPMALVFAVLLSSIAILLKCFRLKATKILSVVLFFLALITDFSLFFAVDTVHTTEFQLQSGFGLVLATLFALLSFLLSVLPVFAPNDNKSLAEEVRTEDNLVNYLGAQFKNTAVGQIAILSGPCAGYKIPVYPTTCITIGKDPSCCSVIIDTRYTAVSRKHCQVRFDPDSNTYLVKDLSLNGTFSGNGVRLQRGVETKLKRGTTIILAKTNNVIILK